MLSHHTVLTICLGELMLLAIVGLSFGSIVAMRITAKRRASSRYRTIASTYSDSAIHTFHFAIPARYRLTRKLLLRSRLAGLVFTYLYLRGERITRGQALLQTLAINDNGEARRGPLGMLARYVPSGEPCDTFDGLPNHGDYAQPQPLTREQAQARGVPYPFI